MTYLTCTKHRSFQRKHIDVCRQCPDNDDCDAFQAYVAAEPPPPEQTEVDIPIRLILEGLEDIHELVADTPPLQKTDRVPHPKKHLQGIDLLDFIRSELGEIRKLCRNQH